MVLCATIIAPSLATAAAPGKVTRQIGVMEKIIDQVLIDSPNFLVMGGDNARGLYIEELGALFTFEASLTGGMFNLRALGDLSNRFEMKTDEDGNQIFVIKKGEKEKRVKEKGEHRSSSDRGEADASDEGMDEAERYEKGKAELIDTVLDYGETLTTLKDGQSVVLAAFLSDSDLFKKKEISRLVIRAKIADLRAYAAGTLSESGAKSRIMVEEY